MSKPQTATHHTNTGKTPVPTFSPLNERITITYSERLALKEVRCDCKKLLGKATPGSVVEIKCKCGKIKPIKVAA